MEEAPESPDRYLSQLGIAVGLADVLKLIPESLFIYALPKQRDFVLVHQGMVVIDVIIGVLLMATGVGLLRGRRWARQWILVPWGIVLSNSGFLFCLLAPHAVRDIARDDHILVIRTLFYGVSGLCSVGAAWKLWRREDPVVSTSVRTRMLTAGILAGIVAVGVLAYIDRF